MSDEVKSKRPSGECRARQTHAERASARSRGLSRQRASACTADVLARRCADSKFKQQNLPAWRPILTPRAVVITFFTIGAIFIPIGAVVLDASEKARATSGPPSSA